MGKKSIIIILSIFIIISGIFILYGLTYIGSEKRSTDNTLPNSIIFGTLYPPQEIDPLRAIERSDQDILTQIYEPLFIYNFSDPELPIIPLLAADFGIWSDYNYTIPLRQNVTFHDGTKFNATSVKWNFERIIYFINASGNLPINTSISPVRDLYFWFDNTPIINRTEIINEWTIKFVLNKKYGPFLDLLTLSSSFIVAPNSIARYEYHDIKNATEFNLIGTGPFKFSYYISNKEVKLTRNSNYWRTPALIENIIISIMQHQEQLQQALLTGEINFLNNPYPNYYTIIREAPNLKLIGTELNSNNIFLAMNNKLINKTWRQAISWAIDYDCMLNLLKEHILENESISVAVRSKSPLPYGMKYFNDSFQLPIFNISKARNLLHAAGIGTELNLSDDDAWRATELYTLNFSYIWGFLGTRFHEDVLYLLQNNLDLIGVTVEDAWYSYYDPPEWEKQMLYFRHTAPEYNDPSRIFNSLMSNISKYNIGCVNDSYLENLLSKGLEEIDSNTRKQVYNEIQRYIVQDLMPYAWCYQGIKYNAMANYIHDFPINMFGSNYFYPCKIY